ncbi:MAG: sigma-70 family RNA polymerase sigma factor [Planctomycetes bacterium]|nr:sigma-70 family RNA polymerase sigma factor [Planctomycetota bacterium]
MTTASENQDQKLMAAVKRGNMEAFEQLFYKYYRRLYALFYRLSWDDGRAEDLLQETFLRVWRGALTFKDDLKVASWIYRIGRNCWIDLEARRKSVRRAVDIESDAMLDSGRVDALSESDPRATTSGRFAAVRPMQLIDELASGREEAPDDKAARRETEEAVRQGLLELDPMHRLVLVMSFYQGMTYSEISEALEVPVGTVKSRVYYAERKLREKLRRHVSDEQDVPAEGAGAAKAPRILDI